jgi:hypothetical protein
MGLDWFEDGALYLLLPEPRLGEWHGTDSTDYDRACAAGDRWLTAIPVADATGFVLGGDPKLALVVLDHDGDVVLIRWVCAEDEHELVAFSLRGEHVVQSEPDLVFDNPAAHWRVFNAAADSIADSNPSRKFVLPVGPVRVQTTYLEFDCNAAIVHRFVRER